MNVSPAADRPVDEALRRKRTRRTAWITAAVAMTVYVAFILSGVLGP